MNGRNITRAQMRALAIRLCTIDGQKVIFPVAFADRHRRRVRVHSPAGCILYLSRGQLLALAGLNGAL